jgi:hypothetical protein
VPCPGDGYREFSTFVDLRLTTLATCTKMVFEPVPNARFNGVVVTTTNRGIANRLPQRAHADGERQVLIRNCRLIFEHCTVTNRFRLVGLNEHDLDAEDRRQQELDSVFFYVTAETVSETRDTRSSTGDHVGGRTTLRSSTIANSSIIFQMNREDNHTLNQAIVAAQEFLLSL